MALSMIRNAPPMSNAERQRRFRARHPNYNRDYKARQRAIINAGAAQLIAQVRAAAAELLAQPTAASGMPEGVWIKLPTRELVPVEATPPEAPMPAPRMMQLGD